MRNFHEHLSPHCKHLSSKEGNSFFVAIPFKEFSNDKFIFKPCRNYLHDVSYSGGYKCIAMNVGYDVFRKGAEPSFLHITELKVYTTIFINEGTGEVKYKIDTDINSNEGIRNSDIGELKQLSDFTVHPWYDKSFPPYNLDRNSRTMFFGTFPSISSFNNKDSSK